MTVSSEGMGVAILSFAHGHSRGHARVFKQLEAEGSVSVVGCWDDNPERGTRLAAEYGIPFIPKLDDLLGDARVRGVTVTNETVGHRAIVERAAAAGKDILVYKPMATTLADCDAMIRATEEAGVRAMMGLQAAFDPANQKMADLVSQGALGRISLLRRRHSISVLLNLSFVHGAETRWHLDPVQNVGMFFDDASHVTFFLEWLLGEPVSVSAEIDATVTDLGTDDTGVAIFRFKNGAFGVIENNSLTHAAENTTEIYGEHGTIVQNYGDAVSSIIPRTPHDVALKICTSENRPLAWRDLGISNQTPHGERLANVARRFVAMLRDEVPAWPTLQHGRRSVEMCLAAYRSAREGRRVTFPLSEEAG